MNPRRHIAGLIVLAGLLAAAATGGSPAEAKARAAAGKEASPKAKFRVTVEGTQQTTWRKDEDDPDLGSCHGGGTEVVSFSTPGALKMIVGLSGRSHGDYLVNHEFRPAALIPADPAEGNPEYRLASAFELTANVQRNVNYTATEWCPVAPDGSEDPDGSEVSNCARSAELPWTLEAPRTFAEDNWIFLVSGGSPYSHFPDAGGEDILYPFPDCPMEGPSPFPYLVHEENQGNPGHDPRFVAAPLSTKKLLDSKRKQFTTSAHGITADYPSNRVDSGTTEVSWTMTLERLGKRK